VGIGYLAVLYIRLGAKFRVLHAKDSNLFRKRLIKPTVRLCNVSCTTCYTAKKTEYLRTYKRLLWDLIYILLKVNYSNKKALDKD